MIVGQDRRGLFFLYDSAQKSRSIDGRRSIVMSKDRLVAVRLQEVQIGAVALRNAIMVEMPLRRVGVSDAPMAEFPEILQRQPRASRIVTQDRRLSFDMLIDADQRLTGDG